MLGIEKEAFIFLYAVLSGTVVWLCYQVLSAGRRLVRHSIVFLNLEDFFYWVGVSVYLFLQMYKTTYGSIRWPFILGVVCGAILANFLLFLGRKMCGKMKKGLEKTGKNR